MVGSIKENMKRYGLSGRMHSLREIRCHRRRFWHATLRLCSAIRQHHPPQGAILSQICCFGERKVVVFQILLDGADAGTTWLSSPVHRRIGWQDPLREGREGKLRRHLTNPASHGRWLLIRTCVCVCALMTSFNTSQSICTCDAFCIYFWYFFTFYHICTTPYKFFHAEISGLWRNWGFRQCL